MPHLQRLYAELKGKGLEILAVNEGDPGETVTRYFRQSGFTFPALAGGRGDGGVFQQYAVDSYPTNFLLDSEGRIVWRAVGYDAKTLEQLKRELARLGVQ